MYVINGFAEIPILASNLPNTVSNLGELSPLSATFSKEKGIFGSAQLGDVVFQSFSCRNEDGSLVATPTAFGSEITVLLNWIYNRGALGNISTDNTELASDLQQQFVGYESFDVGGIITNGTINLPAWVKWNVPGPTPYEVRVWFSDSQFQAQYTEYEIIIVPPVTPVDALFNPHGTVYNLINNRTTGELVAELQEAIGDKPNTSMVTESFRWINSGNPDAWINTEWTAVIYGPAGGNIDNIKAAIVAFILSNSTHTEAEWRALIPSLFISTEYIITPHWDRFSIPNQTILAGMYSATVSPQQVTDYALLTKGSYTEAHVRSTVRASFFTYKTLSFSCVGNIDNIDGVYTFNGKFPDYLPLAPSSLDFNRMSQETRDWANLMNNMLEIAESMTPFSNVPLGMSRIYRNNVMFLGATLNGILYLVTTRHFFYQ